MTRHHRHRAGFSLIELLVVIAIIAVLLALSMGAVMRTRLNQQIKASAMVVEKLQVGVDTQYKAIMEQAKNEIRSQSTQAAAAMMAYFSGDPDSAQAMLAYSYIRQSFPQTFAEVNTVANGGTIPNANVLNGVPYFTVGGFPFLVKSQFRQFVGVSHGTLTPPQQSAVLLYAAVQGTGAGGSTFASDETLAGNQIDLANGAGASFRVFMDAWKQPIGFCRFGTCLALQNPPFVNQSNRNVSNDPLDPAGKLQAAATNLPAATIFNISDAANAITWNGTNRRPVVYSTGPNMIYETLNQTQVTPSLPADDILGYQYSQLGQSGNR